MPGRDIMAQAWYQGGISLFDFTDPTNPVEIGYVDPGPINAQHQPRITRAPSLNVAWARFDQLVRTCTTTITGP